MAGGEGGEPETLSPSNNSSNSSSFRLRVVEGSVGEEGEGGEEPVVASPHSSRNCLFGQAGWFVEGGGGGGHQGGEGELSSSLAWTLPLPHQQPHPPDSRCQSFRSKRQAAKVEPRPQAPAFFSYALPLCNRIQWGPGMRLAEVGLQ